LDLVVLELVVLVLDLVVSDLVVLELVVLELVVLELELVVLDSELELEVILYLRNSYILFRGRCGRGIQHYTELEFYSQQKDT
jgi:hypothetical protein